VRWSVTCGGKSDVMARTGTESPADLPQRSWPATLRRTLLEFKEDKLNHWAA
jgi:hypothetical protein